MRVLLDTQAFLGYVLADANLSAAASASVSDANNQVLISPASDWEIAIKVSLGKYALNVPFEQFWREGKQGNGFEILHVQPRHAVFVSNLPFHHRDPFDRLLVAQAIAEDIPIISVDAALDAYAVRRTW